MSFRTLIVDDDELSVAANEALVGQLSDLNWVASFTDPEKALEYLDRQMVDLVVLDMLMPGVSGLEFLEKVGSTLPVIVITSEPGFALAAFNFRVIDYLIKPVSALRFRQAVDKFLLQSKPAAAPVSRPHVFIRQDNEYIRLWQDDILFVVADGDYSTLHTEAKTYLVATRLMHIERVLEGSVMRRVHRSYMVNINRISKVEENCVVIGKRVIPVGRSYRDALMKELKFL